MASYATDDLVPDSSTRERFLRATEMTGVAFDGDSRNIGMIGACI